MCVYVCVCIYIYIDVRVSGSSVKCWKKELGGRGLKVCGFNSIKTQTSKDPQDPSKKCVDAA